MTTPSVTMFDWVASSWVCMSTGRLGWIVTGAVGLAIVALVVGVWLGILIGRADARFMREETPS